MGERVIVECLQRLALDFDLSTMGMAHFLQLPIANSAWFLVMSPKNKNITGSSWIKQHHNVNTLKCTIKTTRDIKKTCFKTQIQVLTANLHHLTANLESHTMAITTGRTSWMEQSDLFHVVNTYFQVNCMEQ